MCGIIAILLGQDPAGRTPSPDRAAQLLYDGLCVLQHRGQDAAGMCTGNGHKFHLRKANGLSSDVFKEHHMQEMQGHMGIAHCRYPTAGNSSSAEAQPFYTNTPYGLCLAHNGNLTNCSDIRQHMQDNLRHCNTTSDSELLLNVLANELMETATPKETMSPEDVFGAVRRVHKLVRGGYATVAMVSTGGIIAFRDPYGIRPLVFGTRTSGGVTDYLIASESVAIDTAGFELVRDVAPGEAIYIDANGRLFTEQCHDSPSLSPCIFEHVYLARPDSLIDGVSVYASRLRMGEKLAIKIRRVCGDMPIDVVMPVPDTSRPCALEAARCLGLPYREGFIKNRYIARTFIMPGQTNRKKNVRRKLNPIRSEFNGKNILLVDDSIVRGTTSSQIVQIAREAGAASIIFASASPMIKYPNVYGIDMPTVSELIAHGRTEAQVAECIGADAVVYNDLSDLEEAVRECAPEITTVPTNRIFDTSCFTGTYVTGDIDRAYFEKIDAERNDAAQAKRNGRAAPTISVVGGEGELALDGNDGALMNTPRATSGA